MQRCRVFLHRKWVAVKSSARPENLKAQEPETCPVLDVNVGIDND
jgi:hypothetical protein